MGVATEIQPIIKKTIEDFGSTAVLKTITKGVYVVGVGTTDVEATTDIKIIPDKYETSELSDIILSGDIKLLTVSDSVPKTEDKITFNSISYNVINVAPMIFQDVTLYYEIQARV